MIGGAYIVVFKQSAKFDLSELEKFIVEDCHAPLTAKRKFEDLGKRLDWLEKYAELPAIDFNLSYQYGILVRTIPYGKKMTIVCRRGKCVHFTHYAAKHDYILR